MTDDWAIGELADVAAQLVPSTSVTVELSGVALPAHLAVTHEPRTQWRLDVAGHPAATNPAIPLVGLVDFVVHHKGRAYGGSGYITDTQQAAAMEDWTCTVVSAGKVRLLPQVTWAP